MSEFRVCFGRRKAVLEGVVARLKETGWRVAVGTLQEMRSGDEAFAGDYHVIGWPVEDGKDERLRPHLEAGAIGKILGEVGACVLAEGYFEAEEDPEVARLLPEVDRFCAVEEAEGAHGDALAAALREAVLREVGAGVLEADGGWERFG